MIKKFINLVSKIMVDINLKYDVQNLNWHRRSLFGQEALEKMRRARVRRTKRWGYAALAMWLVALMLVVIPNLPKALYAFFPGATTLLAEKLGVTADVDKSQFGEVIYEAPVYVPPFDASLPQENMLLIPKIGFKSKIGEAPLEEIESVLRVGPWRAPDLGTPENRSAPIVIAAHRFGYLQWTNLYRRENSFYNLPKLENGDLVEVVWNQRKYTYEIYEGYTDTKLSNFDADLILFTCEVLNSDRRVVRKARLVIPEENSANKSQFGQMVSYSIN